MNKVLLACYSRSGYTISLAKEIASMTGWDLEEIADVHPRDGNWGAVRCVLDVLLHRRPGIRTGDKDPADYDLVVVAAPVWMRRLAAPMHSYISRHRKGFKALAYVCMYGGKGAERAAAQVERFSGKPLKAMFAVTSQEFEQADYRARLDDFLDHINKA